eukprot:CAMPEP_0180715868 /NCGR_PEP_ID=MMETSP1038_2-20121128/13166_1 /TAXON_ID=632150 /ORGANISM="Azadinium spinosum, Strain 3D9" /LENGTH=61 /DNA_ID=CAMNT_0022748291 /DNA_START=30 /DNA_END=215 /DNA_ORIENTATION=-
MTPKVGRRVGGTAMAAAFSPPAPARKELSVTPSKQGLAGSNNLAPPSMRPTLTPPLSDNIS